jgi:hypothetical protein
MLFIVSHFDQLLVLPYVDVIPGYQKAPTRRQSEVVRDFRMALADVRDVHRLEEIIIGRVFARP